MVDKNSQASRRYDKELRPKGVVVRVIGGTELDKDKIDGDESGQDENDFHHSIVRRDKCREEVKVTRHKDHPKQDLTFSRYPLVKKEFS